MGKCSFPSGHRDLVQSDAGRHTFTSFLLRPTFPNIFEIARSVIPHRQSFLSWSPGEPTALAGNGARGRLPLDPKVEGAAGLSTREHRLQQRPAAGCVVPVSKASAQESSKQRKQAIRRTWGYSLSTKVTPRRLEAALWSAVCGSTLRLCSTARRPSPHAC